MTYEELFATVRNATQNTVVSKGLGHVAYQFNVEGEGQGAFYLELDHGKINVEPYEYYDRDLIIVTTGEVLLQMTEGEVRPMEAYTNGQIHVYNGDPKKLELLPFGCSRKAACKVAVE